MDWARRGQCPALQAPGPAALVARRELILEEAPVPISSLLREEPWFQISFWNVAARLPEYGLESASSDVLVQRYSERLPLSAWEKTTKLGVASASADDMEAETAESLQ